MNRFIHARRRKADADEGASLLIVLVVMGVLGVVLGTLTSFGASSEIVTTALGGQARATYTAGSGLDTAIASISRHPLWGFVGGTCPTHTFNSGADDGVNALAAEVSCAPRSDSLPGVPGGGGVNDNNRPKQAVLTLPDSSDDGFRQASNNDLKVKGDVYTGGPIRIPTAGATLTVNGDAKAKQAGPCESGLNATTSTCDPSVAYPTDPQSDSDSAYASTWVMPTVDPTATPQTVPSSCGVDHIAALNPGRYTDAAGLSALASGGCNDGIIYFKPGNYYFDFGTSPTGTAWNVSNPSTTIIGGLVKTWSFAAGDPVSAYDPTAGCASDDLSPIAGSGVAFVFAGASRLNVTADKSIRLCAESQTTQQEIVIWGVKNTTTIPAQSVTNELHNPNAADSQAVAPDTTAFQNPGNAKTDNAQSATVTLETTKTTQKQATLSMSDFFATDDIPADATIDAVDVKIDHAGTGDLTACTYSVVGSTTAPLACNTANGNKNKNPGPDIFVLQPSDFNTKAKRQAASVKFRVQEASCTGKDTCKNSIAEAVDEVQLRISYTIPAVVGLTGEAGTCVASGSTCPLIATSGTNAQDIYMEGTTYAPKALFDLQLTHEAGEAFSRGIVARSIIANITASSGFTGSVFALPDLSSVGGAANRKVTLTVRINGSVIGTAVVRFDDTTTPATATVLSWNVRHCGPEGCG